MKTFIFQVFTVNFTFLKEKPTIFLKRMHAYVAQSCPTLCDPVDCSLPGSSVHGIFQARVLEWGAIAFSGTIS